MTPLNVCHFCGASDPAKHVGLRPDAYVPKKSDVCVPVARWVFACRACYILHGAASMHDAATCNGNKLYPNGEPDPYPCTLFVATEHSPLAEYDAFLASKEICIVDHGVVAPSDLCPALFPFQRDVVAWSLKRGRAALFEDCGLGKTLQQLEFARQVTRHTKRPVLIFAPLAVSAQTIEEGRKFGFAVRYAEDAAAVGSDAGIVISNYERSDRFDPSVFGGVVLDESSILKSYTGTIKRRLLASFASTPFRLACTATPAPNDHLELGNHAEFLGVMTSHEMIARWFVTDQSEFGTYRLKGHAIEPFWNWVTSWARCAGTPSDLGDEYSDEGYVLPALREHTHLVEADVVTGRGENLFRIPDLSATSVHKEKRLTAAARAQKIADLVKGEPEEGWLVWCDTDYEADELEARIDDAVEIRGSDKSEDKEKALLDFAAGRIRVLVTKPKLAGFGMNFQRCARVAFVGAGFSFEAYYQALRRAWRFGQKRTVDVHVAMAPTELAVWQVMQRKAREHEAMKRAMFAAARRAQSKEDNGKQRYVAAHKGMLPAWLVGEEARRTP